MPEWLKGILGDHYSEEIGHAVSCEIDREFVPREEYNTLNVRFEEAGRQIEALHGLEQDYAALRCDAEEWREKYRLSEHTAAQREYARALEAEASALQFSSQSARKAFLGALAERDLPLEDGHLQGFEEFADRYKADDAGAFTGGSPVPRFVGSTSGTGFFAPDARTQANDALRSLFRKE